MKITVTSGEEDVLSPGGKQPQIDKDDAGQEHVHDRGASPVAIQRLFAGCHFMVPWEPPLCVVVQVRLQVAGMVFIVGMKEQRRSAVGEEQRGQSSQRRSRHVSQAITTGSCPPSIATVPNPGCPSASLHLPPPNFPLVLCQSDFNV